MLSEKRVIHMSRMEMWRKKEGGQADTWLNTDRRDYISFHRVIGFIVGTAFYGVVVGAAGAVLVSEYFTNLSRVLMIGLLLGAVIGYLIFMFFYQRWYYRFCTERYVKQKKMALDWRRDWDILSRIYEEEEAAAKPTVNMDLLFPEGSLGENE